MTLDGQTYTLIDGTERFSIDTELETYTFYQLLQKHYKDQFKSLAEQGHYTLPKDLLRFANAARYRTIRAVQIHNNGLPPLLPNTETLLAAAQQISNSMEDNLQLPGQLSYARWGTGQDEAAAISTICHYGWARSSQKQNIEEFALYSIRINERVGVSINVEYTHSFNERLTAACIAALQMRLDNIRFKKQSYYPELLQVAVSTFFYYKKRYVSATPTFNTMIKATIQHYILQIMDDKQDPHTVPIPEIEEPTNLIEEGDFDFLWEDFKPYERLKGSEQQTAHLAAVHSNQCLEACQRIFDEYP